VISGALALPQYALGALSVARREGQQVQRLPVRTVDLELLYQLLLQALTTLSVLIKNS